MAENDSKRYSPVTEADNQRTVETAIEFMARAISGKSPTGRPYTESEKKSLFGMGSSFAEIAVERAKQEGYKLDLEKGKGKLE